MNIHNDKHKLPVQIKRLLINYVTELPKDLQIQVMANLNDPLMDGQCYPSDRRVLSQYSTLIDKLKSNPKLKIVISNSPLMSWYQVSYCRVIKEIETDVEMHPFRNDLMSIMKIPCYDTEHLFMIEKRIAEIIEQNKYSDKLLHLVNFIAFVILDYKLEAMRDIQTIFAYDILSDIGIDTTGLYSNVLYEIHSNIWQSLAGKDCRTEWYNNIASMMALYFKAAHIDFQTVESNNLAERFFIGMKGHYSETEITEARQIFYSLSVPNLNTYDTVNLPKLKSDDVTLSDLTSDDIKTGNGFTFLFKNDKYGYHPTVDKLIQDKTGIRLKQITPEYIASVFRHLGNSKASADRVSFIIKPIDFGYVLLDHKIPTGNATDIYTGEMKHIAEYNGTWYALFTYYSDKRHIYGINITDLEDDLILEIFKSKKHTFKFISNFD